MVHRHRNDAGPHRAEERGEGVRPVGREDRDPLAAADPAAQEPAREGVRQRIEPDAAHDLVLPAGPDPDDQGPLGIAAPIDEGTEIRHGCHERDRHRR